MPVVPVVSTEKGPFRVVTWLVCRILVMWDLCVTGAGVYGDECGRCPIKLFKSPIKLS
jgi:hypothetical protein